MQREEMIERLAPCSLLCETCEAYEKGVIRETSTKLLKYIEGLKEFYEKHDQEQAKAYAVTVETLQRCSHGICSGCRNRSHHACGIAGCFILDCVKAHGVLFCGECSEFPCERTKTLFEEEVYKQWLSGNKAIKENGIEAFYASSSQRSHYKPYKK